jgi:hypothetical protein
MAEVADSAFSRAPAARQTHGSPTWLGIKAPGYRASRLWRDNHLANAIA